MPLINLRELGKVGGNLATIGGAAIGGYGEDKADALKDALQQAVEQRASRKAALDEAMTRKNLAKIEPGEAGYGDYNAGVKRAEIPVDVDRTTAVGSAQTGVDVARETALAAPKATTAKMVAEATAPVTESTHRANRAFDINNPEHNFAAVTTTAPGGEQHVSTLDTHTGALKDTGAGAKEATGGAGTVRFGQGGPLGAASGLASIKEMHAAHTNMQAFEKGLLGDIPTTQLDALDRFRQRLASGLHDGVFDAAKASEAERELAKTNPELVTYGRNLSQWIVGDMNLSRGGTDARARQDENVSGLSVPLSSMTPAQRATYIQQIWEGRLARTSGLDQAVPAVEAMLRRAAGTHGTATPDHTKLSDEEFARQYKAGTFNRPP